MSKDSSDNAIYRDSLYGTLGEPPYAGALSFMRRKYSRDLDGVDLAVTGIPLDMATTNRPGARLDRGQSEKHQQSWPGSDLMRWNLTRLKNLR